MKRWKGLESTVSVWDWQVRPELTTAGKDTHGFQGLCQIGELFAQGKLCELSLKEIFIVQNVNQ